MMILMDGQNTKKTERNADAKRPVERLVMRPAADNKERRKAALCSTMGDLHPDGNGRVIVSGLLPNGDRIYLGHISETILYQKGVDPMAIIERVRFGA